MPSTQSEEEEYQKDSDSDEEEESQQGAGGGKKKRRRRRKGKGRRRGNNPWEEDSDDSEEEDHHQHYEDEYDDVLEDDEVLRFDENDNEDEFACEEIDPNDEPVVVRRARTVKKCKWTTPPKRGGSGLRSMLTVDDAFVAKDELVDGEELVVNDDKPCGRCAKYDNPQWVSSLVAVVS